MKASHLLRIRLLSGVIVLVAVLFAIRLYQVQIVSGDYYTAKAEKQYTSSVSRVFSRGSILFSNSDGTQASAATLKNVYRVAITPVLIKDPEKAYEAISPFLTLDKEQFLAKAKKQNDPYEEIAKNIDPDIAEKIDELKMQGLETYADKIRYYPQNELAAHTLGFVAYQGNEQNGRYGLEKYYDSVLQRKSDMAYVNFFAEIFSNIKSTVVRDEADEGDIVTTIDPTVQVLLEKELLETNEKYNSKMTGGIIINPKTGEIFAIGAVPTFNLNSFNSEKSSSVYSNPLVETVQEMGSIVKPLTIAAGIDMGVINAKSTYDDKGTITLNNKKISNHDKKPHGITNMQEVLNNSLNLGVAFVVGKMGNENFTDYMYKYGLNQKTGIDLPNEAQSIVSNLNTPRDLEHATAAYGQGIALTPIATVRALSVLANGGTLITPHVVKEIKYKTGLSKSISFPLSPPVLKPETSKEITRMLVEVVDHALLEGKVKMPDYTIAAKTGTAQIPEKGTGGYYEDKYLHSFFGYFPAYNPEFLVFLYTYDPRGTDFASHTLTYPFIDITKFLINYYKIPPDRQAPEVKPTN